MDLWPGTVIVHLRCPDPAAPIYATTIRLGTPTSSSCRLTATIHLRGHRPRVSEKQLTQSAHRRRRTRYRVRSLAQELVRRTRRLHSPLARPQQRWSRELRSAEYQATRTPSTAEMLIAPAPAQRFCSRRRLHRSPPRDLPRCPSEPSVPGTCSDRTRSARDREEPRLMRGQSSSCHQLSPVETHVSPHAAWTCLSLSARSSE